MELNWSTFVLEIFNFLVLLWILKHFLYQPLLEMIARRRAAIENQLTEAEQQHAKADALKQQYESRLADWERERQKAMDKLMREIEHHRSIQLEKLKSELAQEAEKRRVAESRQQQQTLHDIEQRALQQAAEFSSRLLAEAAGPELENRLFELLLDGLNAMPAEQISALSNEWGTAPELIRVNSAYPLADHQRQQLEATLSRVTGLSVPVHYEQDTQLLAGLNIIIGAWLLQLNVRDELQGFKEFTHVEH
ncbi:MAG: F0F1 ATP synthase subunit delta [Gammaproteobacteria bacterium]|nr:F0F1 ATP synthase subunit delta [Gammaproteobacteria bacterium]